MIEGSVFPPMTNERILIMKRILFCISLRFIMASFFVHVTLSEPVVKFFMKFSNNIEEVAWFLIVWFLIVEWFFTLVVTTDLASLFSKTILKTMNRSIRQVERSYPRTRCLGKANRHRCLLWHLIL